MMALRASADDVRLERKLCYDYAKLKAKGKIRIAPARYAPVEQHVSSSSTTIDTSLRRSADVSSPKLTITDGKREGSVAVGVSQNSGSYVPRSLYQILVMTVVTTLLEKLLHM